MSTPHRLVVVGGGVAGLQTARALLKAGFVNVTLLEEADDIGFGSSYKSLSLEVPWSAVQMPEFPLARSSVRPSGRCPTPKEMQEYARAYAKEFGLFNCIKLNSRLVNLAPDARHRWVVSFTNTKEGKHYQITASFVVLCTGIHTAPSIPKFPGAEDFLGKVVHSKDIHNMTELEGKRVVLVGNGRAQSDLQAEIAVAQAAASVLLLNRKLHWPLPERMGLISTKRILTSRWGTSLVPKPYYAASGFSKAMSATARPMKRAIWSALQRSLDRRYKVHKANLAIEELHKDLHWGGHLSEQNWKTLTQQSKIHSAKGRIRLMSPQGLVLDGGHQIACDIIVMCTGYSPSYKFMDPRVNLHLQAGSDGLYLYRHMIHPDVKNLAFVGSMVTSSNHVLTTALQSLWLSRALQHIVKLPSAAVMAKDINAQRTWRCSSMAPHSTRAGLLMPYTQHYHDQLMEDMGQPKNRKGWLFSEWFAPYSAADYASLFDPSIKRSSFKVRAPPLVPAASASAAAHPPAESAGTEAAVESVKIELQRQEQDRAEVQAEQARAEERMDEEEEDLRQKQIEQLWHKKMLQQRKRKQKVQEELQQLQEQQQQRQEQHVEATEKQQQDLTGQEHTPKRQQQQQQEQQQEVLRAPESGEARTSGPLPAKPVRRSVVFDVDPQEGMDDNKPKEGFRRLSRAALEQLESQGNAAFLRPYATLSRQHSQTSFMTREVTSVPFNSQSGDFLDSMHHSGEVWGSSSRMLDSKHSSMRTSARNDSMQSSVDGNMVRRMASANMEEQRKLDMRKLSSGRMENLPAENDAGDQLSSVYLPSGRPSPTGRPSSTVYASGFRSDWGPRDSGTTSKTLNLTDWEGLSTRPGSMRPSTGLPSTKASDLMQCTDGSSNTFSGSQNLGAGTSGKLSLQLSGRGSASSPHNSSNRSGKRLANTADSISEGHTSMYLPRHSESGVLLPARRFRQASLPFPSMGDDKSEAAEELEPGVTMDSSLPPDFADGADEERARLAEVSRMKSEPLMPWALSHNSIAEAKTAAFAAVQSEEDTWAALNDIGAQHQSKGRGRGSNVELEGGPQVSTTGQHAQQGVGSQAQDSRVRSDAGDQHPMGTEQSGAMDDSVGAGKAWPEPGMSVVNPSRAARDAVLEHGASSGAGLGSSKGSITAHRSSHGEGVRSSKGSNTGHSSSQGGGGAFGSAACSSQRPSGTGDVGHVSKGGYATVDVAENVGGRVSGDRGQSSSQRGMLGKLSSDTGNLTQLAEAPSAGLASGILGDREGRGLVRLVLSQTSRATSGQSDQTLTPSANTSMKDFSKQSTYQLLSDCSSPQGPSAQPSSAQIPSPHGLSPSTCLTSGCPEHRPFTSLSEARSSDPTLPATPVLSQSVHPNAHPSPFHHHGHRTSNASISRMHPLENHKSSPGACNSSDAHQLPPGSSAAAQPSSKLRLPPVKVPSAVHLRYESASYANTSKASIPPSHQASFFQAPSSPSLPNPSTCPLDAKLGLDSTSPHLPNPSTSPPPLSPRDGSTTCASTANPSYIHMVSSHMSVSGKKGGARGSAGMMRSTLSDAAVLELLSAPPPIISSYRARSAKLKPPKEGEAQLEADQALLGSPAEGHSNIGTATEVPTEHQQQDWQSSVSLIDVGTLEDHNTDGLGLRAKGELGFPPRPIITGKSYNVAQLPNTHTLSSSMSKSKLGDAAGEESGVVTLSPNAHSQETPSSSKEIDTSDSSGRDLSISHRLASLFSPNPHKASLLGPSPLSATSYEKDSIHVRRAHTQELPRRVTPSIDFSNFRAMQQGETKHHNRRSSISLGALGRNREQKQASSSRAAAHPLASFLYRSADGMSLNAGSEDAIQHFNSFSSPISGPSTSNAPVPTMTTAAAAQHVFQGIINEGLEQLMQHKPHQQVDIQMCHQAARSRASKDRRSSLSSIFGSPASPEPQQSRRSSIGQTIKRMHDKMSK